MRSLFLKIFFWFWLANIVVAAAAVAAALLIHHPEGLESARWRGMVGRTLAPQARAAIEVLEREGSEALCEHLDRQDRASHSHTFLLDEAGHDLHGRPMPPELPGLAERTRETGEVQVGLFAGMTFVTVRVTGQDGKPYVLAREMPPEGELFREPTWHGPPPERPPDEHGHSLGPPRRGPPDGEGDAPAREGEAPAGEGEAPAGEGEAPAGEGEAPAGEGEAPAGEGEAPAEPGPRSEEHPAHSHGHGPPPMGMRPPEGWHGPPPGMDHGRGPRGRPPPGRPPNPLRLFLSEPAMLAAILSAVVATSGMVCYGLARYLTRPVRLLRGAARRLADGDLSARVGVAGRRRDEIGDLGRDFDIMADHLENLLIAQQRLLRDISHELRSPLARLNVALELARRDSGAAAETALARVGREAERLNEMIGQLLMLARLEGAAAQLVGAVSDRVEIDLAALVSEVGADADFEAAVRDCHVRIVQSEPCRTVGAPGLLRSAIENVVRNAVRFTAPGTEVEIRLARRADGAEPRAIIEVRDHGPGVPEAALHDIFRPFYRVADARERETGGAGLGLAITERTIRSYGGTVRAANAPDGGLSVQIELPCTRPQFPSLA